MAVNFAAEYRDGAHLPELAGLLRKEGIPLPADASFDLGASLGVPAITAHRALTSAEFGPSRLGAGSMDGMTVLVVEQPKDLIALEQIAWGDASVVSVVSVGSVSVGSSSQLAGSESSSESCSEPFSSARRMAK